jgi:hypothetical protein
VAVTNSAIRARVSRLVTKWVPILGLESWGLTVLYDEPKHLATCDPRDSYEEATIRFNLKRMRAELPNTMAAYEELTVHELCHCLLPKASERTVSRVTRSILRARDSATR